MANSTNQIVLYDLACIKNVCFSPVVWRIRMMLNYKKVPYGTVFLEFPDIEPTLKGLGLEASEDGSWGKGLYTVPAILYRPSQKYIMGSDAIAQFLEATFPEPALPLSSPLGDEIIAEARKAFAPVLRGAVLPREINILSPRAQEYFRATREKALGHPIEVLDDPEKEEQSWAAAADGMREGGKMMLKNEKDGPFLLGAQPSYADFFIAGNLKFARTVDEGVFQRLIKYPGPGNIYNACAPFMERAD